MSAAGDEDDREELHDLAAGNDVAEPADQYGAHAAEARDDTAQLASGRHDSGSRLASGRLDDEARSPASPHFGLAPDIAAWDTRTDYVEPDEDQLLPPPDFRPFFALIEDPITGEYHHPVVHYVFSDDDDDHDVLTSAALDVVDREENTARDQEMEERIVLLDLQGDGKTIISAASLSPEWQALRTEISQAPSWGDAKQGADRGLMLKVFGKETVERREVERQGVSEIGALVEQFGRQLESLDEILGKEDDQTQADIPSASQSQRPGSGAE